MVFSELLYFIIHFLQCPHAIITAFRLATKTSAILRTLSIYKVSTITKDVDFFCSYFQFSRDCINGLLEYRHEFSK